MKPLSSRAKKLVAVLLFLLAGAGASFSEEALPADFTELNANVVQYVQLDIMVANGMLDTAEGRRAMVGYSSSMDSFYQKTLYKKYEQDILGPIFLNTLTGGMGSLMQGDWLGGLVSQTLVSGSLVAMYLSLAHVIPADDPSGLQVAAVGGTLGFVAGVVFPLVYGLDKNAKLKQALSLP